MHHPSSQRLVKLPGVRQIVHSAEPSVIAITRTIRLLCDSITIGACLAQAMALFMLSGTCLTVMTWFARSATLVGDSVYYFGGDAQGTLMNDLYELKLDTLSWNRPFITGLRPPPRHEHAAAAIGGRLWLSGGGMYRA